MSRFNHRGKQAQTKLYINRDRRRVLEEQYPDDETEPEQPASSTHQFQDWLKQTCNPSEAWTEFDFDWGDILKAVSPPKNKSKQPSTTPATQYSDEESPYNNCVPVKKFTFETPPRKSTKEVSLLERARMIPEPRQQQQQQQRLLQQQRPQASRHNTSSSYTGPVDLDDEIPVSPKRGPVDLDGDEQHYPEPPPARVQRQPKPSYNSTTLACPGEIPMKTKRSFGIKKLFQRERSKVSAESTGNASLSAEEQRTQAPSLSSASSSNKNQHMALDLSIDGGSSLDSDYGSTQRVASNTKNINQKYPKSKKKKWGLFPRGNHKNHRPQQATARPNYPAQPPAPQPNVSVKLPLEDFLNITKNTKSEPLVAISADEHSRISNQQDKQLAQAQYSFAESTPTTRNTIADSKSLFTSDSSQTSALIGLQHLEDAKSVYSKYSTDASSCLGGLKYLEDRSVYTSDSRSSFLGGLKYLEDNSGMNGIVKYPSNLSVKS